MSSQNVPDSPGGIERRKHLRVRHRSEVHVKLYTVSGYVDLADKTLRCHTEDLSIGGIRLSSDVEIPVGCYIEMSVHIENPPKVFTHRGEVRWVAADIEPDKYSIGIEFQAASDGEHAAWRELVDKLQSSDSA